MAPPHDQPARPRILHVAKAFAMLPIDDGPVELPLSDLCLPFLLAGYCGGVHVALRVLGAGAPAISWAGKKGEVVVAKNRDGSLRIELQPGATPLLALLDQLASLLAALPGSTEIEMVVGNDSTLDDDDFDDGGWHRCAGPLRDGQWLLRDYYPPIDAATLREMLAFARHHRQHAAAPAIEFRARYGGVWPVAAYLDIIDDDEDDDLPDEDDDE